MRPLEAYKLGCKSLVLFVSPLFLSFFNIAKLISHFPLPEAAINACRTPPSQSGDGKRESLLVHPAEQRTTQRHAHILFYKFFFTLFTTVSTKSHGFVPFVVTVNPIYPFRAQISHGTNNNV